MTSSIALPDDEIHIWLTKPQNIQERLLLDHYWSLMTAEEQAKQQRYKFAVDQHDALITRGFVRTLLSRYCDRPATEWRFEKGEKDKPEIIDPPLPLRFNISHTHGLIACAVCKTHDVGVDVEDTTRNSDVLAIADRYFSELEVAELFSLPEAQQRSRFFDYWTLKESYIKACGQGLAIPLGDFSFHIQDPSQPSNSHGDIRLSFAARRNDTPEDWQSWLFYPNQQHRMALSIRNGTANTNYKLRIFETVPKLWEKEIQLPLQTSTR